MIARRELVSALDSLLDQRRIPDVSNNGLQVEGNGEIRRLAFAVDSGLATIAQAAEFKADMLIVHHGLFWGQPLPATGTHGARLRALFAANISLYAAHLPLDVHPRFGNNPSILEDAGFTVCGGFAEERGVAIGCFGTSAGGLGHAEICARLERSLGCQPFRTVGDVAGKKFFKAAAITGSGLRYVEQAAVAGAEIFLTGEGSHASYHQAVECGIPCVFFGHYHSETIGVRRLMKHLEGEYGLDCRFIDVPTGF